MRPTQSVWNQVDEAFRLWASGDARAARARLEAVHTAGWRHAYIDLGLAYTARELEDLDAATAAAEAVLAAEPANAAAMLIKADSLHARGRKAESLVLYSTALKVPLPPGPAPVLVRDLDRASAILRDHAADVARVVDDRLAAIGVLPQAPPRFLQSLSIQRGQRRVYAQRPIQYYYPGLAAIEFFDTSSFPWVAGLESAADIIRDEALTVLVDRSRLKPYVEKDHGPQVAHVDIAGSTKWTAFFLYRSGKVVEENAAACPQTMAALSRVPLASASGAMPSVLFSVLEPGAHIPPHHGMTNTRLICHLPILAPEKCSLRVGAEEREWQYGKTLIFDDTIEHEAWNRGTETRILLLFDVWRPELDPTERRAVSEYLAAQSFSETV